MKINDFKIPLTKGDRIRVLPACEGSFGRVKKHDGGTGIIRCDKVDSHEVENNPILYLVRLDTGRQYYYRRHELTLDNKEECYGN